MGKGKQSETTATAQAVARQKELRRRQDRRNMAIIVVVVVVVVVALIGMVSWLILGKKSHPQTQASTGALAISSQVKTDSGFTIGAKGPGTTNTGKPTVEMYYDYSCSHCVLFDTQYGRKLYQQAKDGHITLQLHPVLTQAFPFTYAGTDAAIKTYQQQPEKFWALHEALNKRMFQILLAYQKNKDDAQLAPAQADAVKTVKEVARKVGIKQAIIDSINSDAVSDQLKDWSDAFVKRAKEQNHEAGTPSFVRDGKFVGKGAKTLEDLYNMLVK